VDSVALRTELESALGSGCSDSIGGRALETVGGSAVHTQPTPAQSLDQRPGQGRAARERAVAAEWARRETRMPGLGR